MNNRKPVLTVNASWERSVLATSCDDTALMLTISANRQASPRQTGRAPIDVAFVLDRSGSMRGDKVEMVKEAVNQAVACLGPDDRVALVIFDNEIEMLQPLAPAHGAIREAIRDRLQYVQARGGTNLSGGWLTGCRELAETSGHPTAARLQRAILLTDGQANDGITDPGELAKHATALRQRGVSTTTMGFGHGFDEVLLSGMAEAGGGNFQYIAHSGELAAFFEKEIGGLTEVAALRPQIEVTLPQGLRAHLLNMFPSARRGKTITVDLRDLIDRDVVDLMFVVTHRGNLGPTSATVHGKFRAIDPETGSAISDAIDIPELTFASGAEAKDAPIDHLVTVARLREQALLDQREALRLDREGRFVESRSLFEASHVRLHGAHAKAAVTGYAGMSASEVAELRMEVKYSSYLAFALEAPLGEEVHKERTAFRSNRSRGGRRTPLKRST